MPGRSFRVFWNVYLAFLQPLDQVIRCQIHDLDIVGIVNNRVGHGLADSDTRDPRDYIVQTLDVLDIEGGVDIDPGTEQFLDVQITFWMAATRRVRVGELVDDRKLGTTLQQGIQIHFLERDTSVFDAPPRNDLQPLDELFRLFALVRFDQPDDNVDPFPTFGLSRLKHFVGLAHARRSTKEDLKSAARFLRDMAKKRFRRGAMMLFDTVVHHARSSDGRGVALRSGCSLSRISKR